MHFILQAMLSILIPTFNYSALSLVQEIWQQATLENIDFEIIVQDDASSDLAALAENEKINEIQNCRFERNEKNLARARNLNKLAMKAKFDWLLFMDCDTFPKKSVFILNYLKSIEKKQEIVFGGIAYKKEKPENSALLRWKYGSKREQLNVTQRNKNPYLTTLTSNILISKKIFDDIQFNPKITDYGYEDLVFSQNLKEKNYTITHIDNPCYHLNLELSGEFLAKIRRTLATLQFIEKEKILFLETKIQKTYNLIYRLGLTSLCIFLFKIFRNFAEKNLISNNPSVFIFDLYRLGYFCMLKAN